MIEAEFYEKKNGECNCMLCPHYCKLSPGTVGICGVRRNIDGVLIAESYGRITSIALDPIEKKPLYMFAKGIILSIGSYGCNFHCSFCQNHSISFGTPNSVEIYNLIPEAICELAIRHKDDGNIGIAYTYNEPFISFEYVYDCSRLAYEHGLKNVIVTNGYINPSPLEKLLPYIDALNIDLKSFSADFYKEIGGEIDNVKRTIELSAKSAHVEVTTLIIPNKNDTQEEMDALASWLAKIDPEIPLHITRFRPRHKMTTHRATTSADTSQLKAIAQKHLKYVFAF